MLQAGEGAQHAARANDAGGAQQLGLHFIAAGLQLLGQLFQLQQLGAAGLSLPGGPDPPGLQLQPGGAAAEELFKGGLEALGIR